MSNTPSAKRIQAKLQQVRRLEEEIIHILLENPHCLQDDSCREEISNLAISYLDGKEERIKKADRRLTNYGSAPAIQMSMAIESFEEADDGFKLAYAVGVTAKVLEMSDAELLRIPDEMNDRAFEIAVMCIEEVL